MKIPQGSLVKIWKPNFLAHKSGSFHEFTFPCMDRWQTNSNFYQAKAGVHLLEVKCCSSPLESKLSGPWQPRSLEGQPLKGKWYPWLQLFLLFIHFSKWQDEADQSSAVKRPNRKKKKAKKAALILCIDRLDYRGSPSRLSTWFGHNYNTIQITANFSDPTACTFPPVCQSAQRSVWMKELISSALYLQEICCWEFYHRAKSMYSNIKHHKISSGRSQSRGT